MILTNVDINVDPCYFFGFFVSNSKLRAERSILHINLCLAIAAGIALFLGGLKLTKIRVREITKVKKCLFFICQWTAKQSYFFANASDAVNILKKRSGASVQLARENGGLPSFHAPGVRLARFARKITLTALRVFRAEKKNWLFCILIANGISC